MTRVQTGLEAFIENPPSGLRDQRIGLLCNPASTSSDLIHAGRLVAGAFPDQLKAMYSPQHGFFAEKQDNMIESDHIVDPCTHIPVYSLYGETRIPTRDMLDPIDVLLIDLQDAGTRVYTFMYTMSYCMEAARQFGKQVIVLDRPNPIGGVAVEGNVLHPGFTSFVGRFPIPMRHGLTIGELALLFNDFFRIRCNLEVIPMKNWHRPMYFQDTGLPWIPPSPNLPTPVSAMVYPGQVIWEGTNISEGRGTTQPFELFGAPFLDPDRLISRLPDHACPGAFLRPVVFEPTAGKWSGTSCRGYQIHVTDRNAYSPYRLSLALLQAIMHVHPESFQWKSPPYEYEFQKMPIDLILGDDNIRKSLEKGCYLAEIEAEWRDALEAYQSVSRNYYLYP